MKLRNGVVLIFWIIVLVLAIRFGWRAYQDSRVDAGAARAREVPDVDKECWVIPDTGQCICRHRWTDERLQVPYKECVVLARRR